MKTIVCFGDSNTWGHSPSEIARHPFEKRWTTILQQKLGQGYFIIPEGLNGRTTTFEDAVEKDKNGYRHLQTILETHKPLDLIIIMLGTNDLKRRFSVGAQEIAWSAGNLIDYTLRSRAGIDNKSPEILFVAPPIIKDSPPFNFMLEGAIEKSKNMGSAYEAIAKDYGVPFLNASEVVESSPTDGIHWEEEEHEKFAMAVAQKITQILD